MGQTAIYTAGASKKTSKKLYLNSIFYVVKTVVAIFGKYENKNLKKILSHKGNEKKNRYYFSFSVSDGLRQHFRFLRQMALNLTSK